jgi:hypothetical protein
MLRNYIEKISGIYTGFDYTVVEDEMKHIPRKEATGSRKDMTFVLEDVLSVATRQLFLGGLLGGGFFGRDVWITATHYPSFHPFKNIYNVQKAIILTRNPYDSLFSLFNLLVSGRQDVSLSEEMLKDSMDDFREMVRLAIPDWKYSHEWWRSQKIPTHIIRYEEILLQPVETLRSMFEFLLDESNLSGSPIETRIKQIVEASVVLPVSASVEEKPSKDNRVIYKPRSGRIHGAFDRFDEELKKEIFNHLEEFMRDFCYTDTGPMNRQRFFDVCKIYFQ